jgi:RNA polymerase sigma factor (sigma-70 family)
MDSEDDRQTSIGPPLSAAEQTERRIALNYLLPELVPSVTGYVAATRNPLDEVDDIVNDAFLAAVKKLSGSTEPLTREWVRKVVLELAMWQVKDRHKERKRAQARRLVEVQVEDETELESAASTEDVTDDALTALERREREVALHAEIQKLPKQERQVVLLRLKNKSYEEVAAKMDISVATAKTHAARAKKTLREGMEARGHDPPDG